MIAKAATAVGNALTDTAITAVLGANKVFWELAEEETPLPFANFTVKDSGYASKSRIVPFTTEVFVFGQTLNEAASIAEVIREVCKDTYKWKDRGSESGYTDTEAKKSFIKLTFEFNINA